MDIALSWHPNQLNSVWAFSTLANVRIHYFFKGVSAHAGTSPHLGRSALDALELMNMGVQFLREHIIPEARIHYAITNTGGDAPNVVQAEAESVYLIRAPKNDQVREIYERVNQIARGAAMMCGVEVEIQLEKACSNILVNHTLEEVLYENMKAVGLRNTQRRSMPLPAPSRTPCRAGRSWRTGLSGSWEKRAGFWASSTIKRAFTALSFPTAPLKNLCPVPQTWET